MAGQDKADEVDKSCAAVCGLFCEACSLYIGSTEEPERLEYIAREYNMTVEEMRCLGCRSEKLSQFCLNCKFVECAAGKGIDFCVECDEFPCAELKEFQCARAHRIELWEDFAMIKELGCAAWLEQVRQKYACSVCSTLNSAYDPVCRKCGNEPSNQYVARHKDEIQELRRRTQG